MKKSELFWAFILLLIQVIIGFVYGFEAALSINVCMGCVFLLGGLFSLSFEGIPLALQINIPFVAFYIFSIIVLFLMEIYLRCSKQIQRFNLWLDKEKEKK